MAELFFLPEAAHNIVAAGISIHGTGFDREAIIPSALVIGFFLWCMKGAPVNEKAQGGFTLGWVLLLAFLVFGLLIPPESFGAASGWPSYAPEGAEVTAYLDRPRPAPWSGLPVTPIIILAVLWFVVPSDGGKAKAKPKSKASKPDPLTDALVESLRNGKRALIPAVPLLFAPALANATTGPFNMTADSASWWVAPTYLLVAICAALTVPVAVKRGRIPIAIGLALICVHSGVSAYRLSVPEAAAGMVGNLFESDGEKAVKEAEAERVRLEADARYRREIALLQSRGFTPADPDRNMVPITIVFVVAIGATLLYWIELRTRAAKEEEIRQLQARLAVAESRRREDDFFIQARRQIAYREGRHGR